jgi:nucleoside-diphosphate-sugar epimerase
MNKLLIGGFGYTASILARKCASKDFKIIGTTRDSQKKILASQFLNIINYQEFGALLENSKEEITHLMLSAPPSDKGDPFFLGYQNYISEMKSLKWIGYLSATNVYGDYQGQYVDELSATKPTTQKGQNRLLAEEQWLSTCKANELPLHIFRIAGIYGEQRNIYEKIKKETLKNIVKHGQFFSRIHVSDLVNVLLASMKKPNPINVYNVSDDFPSSLSDVIKFVCELAKLKTPEEINYNDLDQEYRQNSFYAENKKIANRHLKEDLGIILEYPSYREGYLEIINNDK